MNAYHAVALKAATREEIETIKAMAFKVNEVMKQYFDTLNVILVDFKLEFGKTADGKIVLADEIISGYLPPVGQDHQGEAG